MSEIRQILSDLVDRKISGAVAETRLMTICRKEKEDMSRRNELLRRRLDAHPEAIKPRLKILEYVDELEEALKQKCASSPG